MREERILGAPASIQTSRQPIGDWSEQQVAEMLHTGNTPNHGRVGSSMADVVSNTAMLPDSDREAIAVYLKSLPPRPTPRP